MPLTQIIKTDEDVSYAASSLSGAEILGIILPQGRPTSHLSFIIKRLSMLPQVACD